MRLKSTTTIKLVNYWKTPHFFPFPPFFSVTEKTKRILFPPHPKHSLFLLVVIIIIISVFFETFSVIKARDHTHVQASFFVSLMNGIFHFFFLLLQKKKRHKQKQRQRSNSLAATSSSPPLFSRSSVSLSSAPPLPTK